ncbi:MAG: hypothetical protein NTZ42_01105 [Candidatus Gribaldobacteria bacterium]|nr:hypothetical protein [Candidatus Gribaldobacteria bacterium]
MRAYLVVGAENITTVKACATVVIGAENQEQALKKGAIKLFGKKARDQWFLEKLTELSLVRAVPRYNEKYRAEREAVAEDIADDEDIGDWKSRVVDFIENNYHRPVKKIEKPYRFRKMRDYENYYKE